jgi:hypothetical protein
VPAGQLQRRKMQRGAAAHVPSPPRLGGALLEGRQRGLGPPGALQMAGDALDRRSAAGQRLGELPVERAPPLRRDGLVGRLPQQGMPEAQAPTLLLQQPRPNQRIR